MCSDCDTRDGSRHTRMGSLRSSTRGAAAVDEDDDEEDDAWDVLLGTVAEVGVGVLGFTSAEDDRSSLSTEERDTERSVTLTPESLEPSQWSILELVAAGALLLGTCWACCCGGCCCWGWGCCC